MDDPLAETREVIARAPESAAALTLYALVSTLEHERAGCLFKLTKLRELDEPQRRIAYALMEIMADQGVGDDAWRKAKEEMDTLVRGS
jgi:hypothetical protein